jgi:folate-binding protein YgfZ
MPEKPFFVKLKNRALIHLEGPDRHEFLQGLITNDIKKLTPSQPLYACLLTPQGKFLYDFFVIEGDDFTLLDCEAGENGERAQSLYKKLTMYRLRADVQISVENTNDVYATFNAVHGLPDPRHPEMGNRSFEKPHIEERPFEEWDSRRINITIPDGSRDLIVEKSTMDEAHMAELGAVDYDKGCYVGQELTARMHYRGLGKKHLQTVKLNALPEKAELRSQCGKYGIALVKGKKP